MMVRVGVGGGGGRRRRLRCRPKSFLAWTLLAAATAYFMWPRPPVLSDLSFNQQNKCPACFGESLCPDIFANRISLANDTTFAERIFNAKNVFRAELTTSRGGRSQKTKIVLKKLGHNSELTALDARICALEGRAPNCIVGHSLALLASRLSSDMGRIDLDKFRAAAVDGGDADAMLCLRSQRLLDKLLARSSTHASSTRTEQALTTLLHNPEPLIFATFPAEEGWPFPPYLGSCGRVAAFEHSGKPLAHFYYSDWLVRARLSRQLLEMALSFTRDHEASDDFAMYLTDWSPDNFAVSAQDGRVRLVDGENIVLVDIKFVRETRGPGWNVVHNSQGCEDGFCFVAEDLCTHVESDLNVYGVCRGLLAAKRAYFDNVFPGGLLHDIPADILRRHPLISRMLAQCSEPSHSGGRFEAAAGLVDMLKHV